MCENYPRLGKESPIKTRGKNTENKLVVTRGDGGGRTGKIGEGDEEVQTSSYKINVTEM